MQQLSVAGVIHSWWMGAGAYAHNDDEMTAMLAIVQANFDWAKL